jgi:hypothetical protein
MVDGKEEYAVEDGETLPAGAFKCGIHFRAVALSRQTDIYSPAK